MQPTPSMPRRKRKRPEAGAVKVKAEAEADGHSSSETEEEKAPARKKKAALGRSGVSEKKERVEPVEPNAEVDPAEATRVEEPVGLLERPFRGKCLYQSRKCENERALKRNGKAHNLCDEHRSKQNQHQRKFDAKKYSRRTTDGSSGDEEENEHEDDPKARQNDKVDTASVSCSKPSALAVVREEDPKAPVFKAPRRLQTKSLSEGAETKMIHKYSHTPETAPQPHSHRPTYLDPRRPPPLQVVRTPPATFGDLMAHRLPPHTEARPAPLPPPPARSTVYASPRGHATPFVLLPRPSMRSHSFDSGISRISPVGGAYPGIGGLRPVDRQHQFLQDQRLYHQQQFMPRPVLPTGTRSPKLPSLQQLPLSQPTYSYSQGLTLSTAHQSQPAYQTQHRHSPPYYASSLDPRHAVNRQPPPLTRGPLLPPLAPLLQPPHQNQSPSAHSNHQSREPRHPHADTHRQYQ